ncbi:UNVERIFIED_ORG: 2-iminobutanoate/2-iminopropanoate deaminase [Pseudomonas parafulva]|nr:2-iminobutanoate/2-iminopropanoate deaminase [Pseudomonas parafulva]
MSTSHAEHQVPSWSAIPSQSLPTPHFKYSPIVRAGSFLFVSGMVGLDREHGGLVAGGLEVEARAIFQNLKRACLELEVGFHQLMLVRVYCCDFAKFGEFNAVWDEYFKDQTPPARTSIGVSALPLGALIEMEFQFAID